MSKISCKYLKQNSIGYVVCTANDFLHSQVTFITSSCYWGGEGFSIEPNTFSDVCVFYTIRKSIKKDWYNNNFPFFEPDLNNSIYSEFKKDSVIFTLFHVNNNSTSIKVSYMTKTYDIKNHFFPLTKQEFLNIENLPKELYNDCINDTTEERHVANWLQNNKNELSKESIDLLNAGIKLIKETIPDRLNTDPYYQLNRWDAGISQIRKGILENPHFKEKYKDVYTEFKNKRRILEEKCRNSAEELGCWWKVEEINE